MVDIKKLQRQVRDKREPPKPNDIDKLVYNIAGERLTAPVILGHVKNTPQVVHGARAMNKQLPYHLRRRTKDWDILTTESAMRNADLIEDKLDKIWGKDMFYVRVVSAGYNTIVFRVISRASKLPVVDYIAEKTLPDHIVVDNVKFEALKVLRERAFMVLHDPKLKFKHHKSRADIRLIDAALRFKKMKRGLIPW